MLLRQAVGVAIAIVATVLCAPAAAATTDWPSYNRSLMSDRFAPLNSINAGNVSKLKELCTYDTKQTTPFQSDLIQVGDAVFAGTEHDSFAIDATTCREKWRVHADFPSTHLGGSRGIAVLDGKVFRGLDDGHVVAYDAKSGKLLWSTLIAKPSAGELIPAAPIAWNGMLFIGIGGGDDKGVKGRMYALDVASGKVLWEFYIVPRAAGDVTYGPEAPGAPTALLQSSWKNLPGDPITGGGTWTSYTLDPDRGLLYVPGGNPAPDFAEDEREGDNLFTGSVIVLDANTGRYRQQYKMIEHDFHDWDLNTAPALFTTKSGRRLLAESPKNGRLYVVDLASEELLYNIPMTITKNATAPLTASGTYVCPGTQGGAEWNGPAYDVLNDTLFTGEVNWCTVVTLTPPADRLDVPMGQSWTGEKVGDGAKGDEYGKQVDQSLWSGWITASDPETGAQKWRFQAPFPVLAGITPTAGGIVLCGDMGGNFYVFNSASGKRLWSQNLGGSVAGGVITYDAGAGQRIAVAVGMTSPIWPTQKVTGKIVILGLP